MSEQGMLFDPHRSIWVQRLWRQIDPKVRRQVISMVAQMARTSLVSKAELPKEKSTDES